MIKIITDSTSDISIQTAAALGIEIVPLTIHFGEEEFLDGITISHEEFYSRLESSEQLPVTSQPSPAKFEELFTKHISNGDKILGIFISSDLSGTFQSASIAAMNVIDEFPNAEIELVDSRNVSLGIGILVNEAVQLRDNGFNLNHIARRCKELTSRIRLFAMAGSLKYLQKGGRLSASTAFVGSLLNIKPIIEIVDGKVISAANVRGRKSAAAFIQTKIKDSAIEAGSTFKYGHANASELLDSFKSATEAIVSDTNIQVGSIGCVVGTHIGPGSYGIAYVEADAASEIKRHTA